MSSPQEWAELQAAADHATVRRAVRGDGIALVVWGVLMAAVGAAWLKDFFVATLGFVLVASGAWQIAWPSPAGFRVSGVLIGIIGALNILGTVLGLATGNGGAGVWLIVGVMQLRFAAQLFARHRRFAGSHGRPVTPVAAQRAQELLARLRGAREVSAPDVIEFDLSGWPVRRGRAQLGEHGAFCVIGPGDDVRVLTRAQLHIERTGKALIGDGARVTLRIAEQQFKGSMSAVAFERYGTWKSAAAPMRAAA